MKKTSLMVLQYRSGQHVVNGNIYFNGRVTMTSINARKEEWFKVLLTVLPTAKIEDISVLNVITLDAERTSP